MTVHSRLNAVEVSAGVVIPKRVQYPTRGIEAYNIAMYIDIG